MNTRGGKTKYSAKSEPSVDWVYGHDKEEQKVLFFHFVNFLVPFYIQTFETLSELL